MNTSGVGGGSGGGGSPFSPGPLLSGVAGNNNDTAGPAAPQAGDIIIGSLVPLWTRLGIGTTGLALTVAGTGLPAWAVLGVAGGGTSFSTYTTGDLIYASAANTLAKRAIGSTGQVLTVSGGVPTWVSATTIGTGPVFQFLPAQNEPPTTNPGTFGVLTASTGQRPYLEFDGTTDETSIMSAVLRNYAGGGVTITFYLTMDSTNTGTKVVKLAGAFELVQSGDVLGAGGNDFASAQTVEGTVNNTAGTCFTLTLAFTDSAQMDSIVTGSFFRFKLMRNNSTSGTNATGRLRMLAAIANNT